MSDMIRIMDVNALLEHIYVYDHQHRSVYHPGTSQVPWPVALLLGGCSRKHIFVPSSKPKIEWYGQFINNFINKLCWKLKLGSTEKPWFSRFADKGKPTKACSDPQQPPEVKAFVQDLRAKLHSALIAELGKAGFGRHSNMCKAHHLAFTWLRANGWRVEPSDKDGGHVLMKLEDLKDLKAERFIPPTYFRVQRSEIKPGSIMSVMRRHFRQVERATEENGIAKFFEAQARRADWRTFASRILVTVKTHKPAGNVGLRIIHSGHGHPLSAFSRFLAYHIRMHLAACDHIHGSTASVIKYIHSLKLSRHVKFYRIDIKDFYMQGLASLHRRKVLESKPASELKSVLTAALEDLLCFQYVYDGDLDMYFQVLLGSGQGHIASGEIADATFYAMCEQHFAAVPYEQRKHGVQGYARYRDDIFIISEPGAGVLQFFKKMKSLCAGVYELACDKVDSNACEFLDFEVFKGRAFWKRGFLEFRPYRKQTAQHVPLHFESGQPMFVHKSWPKAEIARIASLSSNESIFEAAKSVMLYRFGENHMAKPLLDELSLFSFSASRKSVRIGKNRQVSWLVLPYHAAVSGGRIGRLLKGLLDLWTPVLKPAVGTLDIRLSLCNMYPNLSRKLKYIGT